MSVFFFFSCSPCAFVYMCTLLCLLCCLCYIVFCVFSDPTNALVTFERQWLESEPSWLKSERVLPGLVVKVHTHAHTQAAVHVRNAFSLCLSLASLWHFFPFS